MRRLTYSIWIDCSNEHGAPVFSVTIYHMFSVVLPSSESLSSCNLDELHLGWVHTKFHGQGKLQDQVILLVVENTFVDLMSTYRDCGSMNID